MGIKSGGSPLKKKTSRVPLKDCNLPEARLAVLRQHGHDIDLPGIRAAEDASTKMVENAVGSFPVPLCVATNFIINGQERLVLMATEEKSVIAGASYAAKLCRETGGFKVDVGPNVMRGQILFVRPKKWAFDAGDRAVDAVGLCNRLAGIQSTCRQIAEELDNELRPLRSHGGGLVTNSIGNDLSIRQLESGLGMPGMLSIDFQMKVGDAMGANVVTQFGEKLAARLESVFGVKRTAVICSNDCSHLAGPAVKAEAVWPVALIGEAVAESIIQLQDWADHDPFRAVTHNKGIMNGVSAVAQATGQDVRAIEAAFHTAAALAAMPYAQSKPTTRFFREGKNLEGRLILRVPLGTVGGATGHPTAVAARKAMGVESVQDLATIIGAVGLAQNFAALRSLASEGIGEAHRRLAKK